MKKQCEVAEERDALMETLKYWRKDVMSLLKHTIRSTPLSEGSFYSLPATPKVSKILHKLEDRLAGM